MLFFGKISYIITQIALNFFFLCLFSLNHNHQLHDKKKSLRLFSFHEISNFFRDFVNFCSVFNTLKMLHLKILSSSSSFFCRKQKYVCAHSSKSSKILFDYKNATTKKKLNIDFVTHHEIVRHWPN